MLDNINRNQLTSEEQSVTVPITSNTHRFTQEHCDTYNRLRTMAAYPQIFGSLAPRYLKYLGTKLVNISDIKMDNIDYEQSARFSANVNEHKIKADIEQNGYSLTELGIALMITPQGKYKPVNGQTRKHILHHKGMQNVIADIFDTMSADNVLRVGGHLNTINKPYGEATVVDIKKIILNLVKMGGIPKCQNTKEGRDAFTEYVLTELNFIGGGKLMPADRSLIVFAALQETTGVENVKSFPNGNGAKDRIIELVGREKYNEDHANGIRYIPVASWLEKLHPRMVTLSRKMLREQKNIKEVRFIIHPGVLKPRDPENEWIKTCANFKKDFDQFELDLAEYRFHGVKVNNSKIKIYGAIPAVRSLEHKYPMDRLYVYN